MLTPNLAVDHMADVPLARTADVRAAIYDRPYVYQLAARQMGLTDAEYAEFARDLEADAVTYGAIPRNMDAMGARRAKSGTVYVLRHTRTTTEPKGWFVRLKDGLRVYVLQTCRNLAVDFPPRSRRHVAPPFRNTSFRGYFTPVVVTAAPAIVPSLPPEPYVYATPQTPTAAAPVASGNRWAWAALAWPIAASFFGGGSGAPPCSAGSNLIGACRER